MNHKSDVNLGLPVPASVIEQMRAEVSRMVDEAADETKLSIESDDLMEAALMLEVLADHAEGAPSLQVCLIRAEREIDRTTYGKQDGAKIAARLLDGAR